MTDEGFSKGEPDRRRAAFVMATDEEAFELARGLLVAARPHLDPDGNAEAREAGLRAIHLVHESLPRLFRADLQGSPAAALPFTADRDVTERLRVCLAALRALECDGLGVPDPHGEEGIQ